MQSKYIKRYETFCRALDNLLRCRNLNPDIDCIIEGTIQRFNLAFDISWKVMKDILVKEKGISNFATGSPRDTLKTAFSCNIINDDVWLDMLDVRNTSVHDYDGDFARESFSLIINNYCNAFLQLKYNIADYYNSNQELESTESNIFTQN